MAFQNAIDALNASQLLNQTIIQDQTLQVIQYNKFIVLLSFIRSLTLIIYIL